MSSFGSSTFSGNGWTLVNVSAVNDPQGNGPSWEYTYTGTQAGINTLAAQLSSAGIRHRTTSGGGDFGLVATYTGVDKDGNPATEIPADSYSIDTEGVNVSIWSHPLVTAEANAYTTPTTVGSFSLISSSDYRKQIETALSEGTANPHDTGTYPAAVHVYSSLARGQEYYELRRPILRRTRTFSFRYADKLSVTSQQPAWTTASLITAFSLPTDISSRLPSDPPSSETPAGTQWVWRLTTDSSEYSPASRKWIETRTWVFEAVDPFYYSVT